ncbi:hypothetical protein STEG23_005016 [Scotinomys teguina]
MCYDLLSKHVRESKWERGRLAVQENSDYTIDSGEQPSEPLSDLLSDKLYWGAQISPQCIMQYTLLFNQSQPQNVYCMDMDIPLAVGDVQIHSSPCVLKAHKQLSAYNFTLCESYPEFPSLYETRSHYAAQPSLELTYCSNF